MPVQLQQQNTPEAAAAEFARANAVANPQNQPPQQPPRQNADGLTMEQANDPQNWQNGVYSPQVNQGNNQTPVTPVDNNLETPVNQNKTKVQRAIDAGSASLQELMTSTGLTQDEVTQELSDPLLQNRYQKNSNLNQEDAAYRKMIDNTNSITNGTFQLNPEDDQMIKDLQARYDRMRKDQLNYNQMYEGITGAGLANFQEGGFIQTNSVMANVIDRGVKKIQNLDSEAASALTTLRQAIKDRNYKLVSAQYDATQKYLKNKSTAIKETYDAIIKAQDDAYKKQQDTISNQLKFAEFDLNQANAILNQSKFSYQQKQDAIDNILANDKWTWQQKQDLIKNDLDAKKYLLDVQKASAADTPENYKEWQLTGGLNSGVSYSEFLLGKGKTSDKPATADQSKNAGYAIRMKDANTTIGLLTEQFKNKSLMNQAWQTNAPSWLKSNENQMLDQAERDFVNAVLRRESGAAISDSEFNNARKQYFPQPGDSDAVLAQKARNRISNLKGVTMSSGNALSDEFKNNLNTVTYPDLKTYFDLNPDKKQVILDTQKTIQDVLGRKPTDDEVLQQIMNDEGGGQQSFNNVGGDTNSAILKKVAVKQDNTVGGQCGRFVNKLTGLSLGDSYQSKLAQMDPTIKRPAPGMVFTMPYKSNGHTGIILAVNNDGTATVKDSNYKLDGKIRTHNIQIAKMTGFRIV